MSHNTLVFNPATKVAEIFRSGHSSGIVRNVSKASAMRIERVTYRYFTRLIWQSIYVGPETCKEWGAVS